MAAVREFPEFGDQSAGQHVHRLQQEQLRPPPLIDHSLRVSKAAAELLQIERPPRAHAPETDEDARLISGWYGPLHLDKRRQNRQHTRRLYAVTCRCGTELWMTAQQIWLHFEKGAGCLGLACPHSAPAVRLWHNPEYSLRMQHRQMLRVAPEDVANEWGGRMADTGLVAVVCEDEGLEAFLEHVRPLVDVEQRRWWVHRENPPGFLMPGNVWLESLPEQGLMDRGCWLFGDEASVDVETLAQELGVDPDRALELSETIVDDDALVDAIIGEKGMSNTTVIKPGDPAYSDFNRLVSRRAPGERRFRYDDFAREYNDAPVSSFIIMHGSTHMKVSNVHHVLENRGLEKDSDYAITRPTRSTDGVPIPKGKRRLVVEKLRATAMEILSDRE